jgi:hypothetical protein
LAELSEKELLAEAEKIKAEANKKIKILKDKARQKREKDLAKFGELTIKFLNKEIEKDELKSFAINHKFIKEEEI